MRPGLAATEELRDMCFILTSVQQLNSRTFRNTDSCNLILLHHKDVLYSTSYDNIIWVHTKHVKCCVNNSYNKKIYKDI